MSEFSISKVIGESCDLLNTRNPTRSGVLVGTDTQRGVLSGLSRERNLRSKIWWFTEFCNSHYVSHFAAFFIVARTEISVANSCTGLRKKKKTSRDPPSFFHWLQFEVERFCWIQKGLPPFWSTTDKQPWSRPSPSPRVKAPVAKLWSSQRVDCDIMLMILPQVHLRKPCYDFYFL